MAMAVQLDLVTRCDDLGGQRWPPLNLLPGKEKGCRSTVLAQHLHHSGSALRVWPIVEGEGDPGVPFLAHLDIEGPAETRDNGRESGAGV